MISHELLPSVEFAKKVPPPKIRGSQHIRREQKVYVVKKPKVVWVPKNK